MDITQLLTWGGMHHASDLHLSAGQPPMVRIHGAMRQLHASVLDHATVHHMVCSLMNDAQRHTYAAQLEVDFAVELTGLGRFRVNAFVQQRGAAAVLRTISSHILTLQALRAPSILAHLALQPRGLVLVTGPTGSGKSTTLAAMVDHLNRHQAKHILTIEDPIEFIHTPNQCLINQREVGAMTHSFANALRAALREDPDCIMVGELRDLDTIRLALTAAETGHLVLATLHTSGAPQTIDRIVDVFAGDEKATVRAILAEALLAVVSQTLCPTKDGQGRVAAYEVMVATPAIRNLIREAKIAQIYSALQTGAALGMQTLDQHLQQLVQQQHIDIQQARQHARFPSNFAS